MTVERSLRKRNTVTEGEKKFESFKTDPPMTVTIWLSWTNLSGSNVNILDRFELFDGAMHPSDVVLYCCLL